MSQTERIQEPRTAKLFWGTHEVFEGGLVADDNCRALNLHVLLLPKAGKKPRHGLTRYPNDLCDFLVSQGQFRANLALPVAMVSAPIQKKPSQLFSSRMRKPDRGHFSDGCMVGFNQLLSHAEGGLAVFPEKT